MCLSVLQLFDDEVLNIYNTVKAKYEAMGPDKYKRFIHIKGVCQMASYLANEYHVNLKDAQIAALLHDYYKYETPEEMSKVLSKEEIEECTLCPVLFHAYSSSKVLKKLFNIDNKEIETAIKYHVFGHPKMSMLDKIILISDYTEINRTYKDCQEVRKILLGGHLDLAILVSTRNIINLLLKENKKPHPMQYEVLNEYERIIKMDKIEVVLKALSKVNANTIKAYDTNEKSPFFASVVIASVDSVRQLNAALEYLKDGFGEAGYPIKGFSGANTEWVLLDGCDILVHVFYKEERDRFDLDKMFMDCNQIDLSKYNN